MKVTVIIPIHNSEKYLKECIKSALSQTFQDMEILCVDSESKDASPEIINEMSREDERIRYLKDTDSSYGHKINTGIDLAEGKYIAILESDDKMRPDMIERLYAIAEKYDTDIADGDFYEMLCDGDREICDLVKKYASPDIYGRLLDRVDMAEREIVTHGIWTALYKKDFLTKNHIRLHESAGASYQDMSFLFLTSILAERVYHLDVPLYQYRMDNTGSSVRDDHKIFEIIGECEYLKNELQKRNMKDERIRELYYIRKYNAFYWNYCRLSKEARKIFLVRYEEELRMDTETGRIRRDMFTQGLYYRTFQLLDDREAFLDRTSGEKRNPLLSKIKYIVEKTVGRKIVIFGAGILGTEVIRILVLNEIEISGICDNSNTLQGEMRSGIEIISVESAVRLLPDAIYVIVNRNHGKAMKEQLLEEGIKESDIIDLI